MILLKPFGKQDFKTLMKWVSDEDLLMHWSGALFTFPLTDASLAWYIKDTNIDGSSDAFVYKAIESTTGETVGHISIGGISWKNRCGRITRVIVGNEFRGKGYCSQMVQAALEIGFNELNLHRVELGVYDDNKKALSCYTKCGFQVEGISRDILWYQDKWLSMVDLSILEGEWKHLNGKKEPAIDSEAGR